MTWQKQRIAMHYSKEKRAEFVTCYLVDFWTIQKIRMNKKWPREKEKPTTELDGAEDSA